MKVLQIVNPTRQLLAQIIWESPNEVKLDFSGNTSITGEVSDKLRDLLEASKLKGLPLYMGRKEQDKDGHAVFVEEYTVIKADREEFLPALGDFINLNHLLSNDQNERLFAFIQP